MYRMAVDVLGVAAIVFFYLLILIVGIWAGKKGKAAKVTERSGLRGRRTTSCRIWQRESRLKR